MTLTLREEECLKYLRNRMEATSTMVGNHIDEYCQLHSMHCGGNTTGVGAWILGRLRKKGLVMRLPELKAWRLSKEGREYFGKDKEP